MIKVTNVEKHHVRKMFKVFSTCCELNNKHFNRYITIYFYSINLVFKHKSQYINIISLKEGLL